MSPSVERLLRPGEPVSKREFARYLDGLTAELAAAARNGHYVSVSPARDSTHPNYDDDVEIQRVLSEAADSAVVLFQPGIYRISKPIVLSAKNNLTLVGWGAYLTFSGDIDWVSIRAGILLRATPGLRIIGFTFAAQATEARERNDKTASLVSVIPSSHSEGDRGRITDLVFSHCKFRNLHGTGLSVQHCNRLTLRDCAFGPAVPCRTEARGKNALCLLRNCNEIVVDGCTFDGGHIVDRNLLAISPGNASVADELDASSAINAVQMSQFRSPRLIRLPRGATTVQAIIGGASDEIFRGRPYGSSRWLWEILSPASSQLTADDLTIKAEGNTLSVTLRDQSKIKKFDDETLFTYDIDESSFCRQVKITNSSFRHTRRAGVFLLGCTDFLIHGCSGEHCLDYAFDAEWCSEGRLSCNHVTNAPGTNAALGLLFYSRAICVTNNVIAGSMGAGLEIHNRSEFSDALMITGNIFERPIRIRPYPGSTGGVFRNIIARENIAELIISINEDRGHLGPLRRLNLDTQSTAAPQGQ